MIIKSDINKLVCILFVCLSSISLENFKDLALIIPEILGLIKRHTYKFGLVYIPQAQKNPILGEAHIQWLMASLLLQIFTEHLLINSSCETLHSQSS